MKKIICFKNRFAIIAILSLGTGLLASPAQAAATVFTINSTQSQITLSGSIAGSSLVTQGPGSLTTSYTGSINADVTGATIQLTGASLIDARTNGVWQPGLGGAAGVAPADYGGQAGSAPFNIFAAARNIIFDVTSPVLPLAGGNFDSTALIFSFSPSSSPVIDYSSAIFGSGTSALTGFSTNTAPGGASLTNTASGQRLSIQINTTFNFTVSGQNTVLTLIGQIVATNSITPSPVFTSIIVSNQNAVLTAQNASLSSQLLSSTNLVTWLAASPTVISNSGGIIYTVPLTGHHRFFRVQK